MADARTDAVVAAVRDAARLAHASWQREFKSWDKSPGNPVSEVDLAIDRMLRDRLFAIDPGAGWLSEETADNADRLACERVWVVDPIDGTRDFVRRRPGWAISVALVERGQPVIAVLDAPARGEVWIAAAGQGATLNGALLRASPRSDLPGARVPADHLPEVDRDLVLVDKPNSIALRIAMVASGAADLLATLRWGHEWDIAAAVLIARESGAVATDALGRKLRFNTPAGEAFGVLATAPGIHAAAVERLRDRAIEGLGTPR